MALAVFMIHLLRGRVKYIVPVMFTFAFLNAYSRIYLGVHYPGDVLVGAIVGLLVAVMIIQLWKFLSRKFYAGK
jgi:undecaprenyl-diphosphatase